MLPRKLIIFDYSGTLSLESTLFGEPDYLMKQLKDSGLMDLGVTSPLIFWDRIVNPTWAEVSTTHVGYKKVIRDRITAILHENKSFISRANVSDAASFFVDSYLSHSRIDSRWQPVLEKLNIHPSVRAIIATDHYAEATRYILRFLDGLHIQAVPAKAAMAAPHSTSVVVANSADLGFHKDDLRFWEILKNGLSMGGVGLILLIDDFGSNERIDDSYSAPEKVERRKRDTVGLLQQVFPTASVQTIPFVLDDKKDEKAFSDLITETAEIIDRYVISVNGGE